MSRGRRFSTQERQTILKAVLTSVEHGVSLGVAAEAGGLSRATLYRWAERCPSIRRRLDSARAKAVESIESVVWQAAAAGDLKAARLWLGGNMAKYGTRPALARHEAPPIGRHYAVEVQVEPPALALAGPAD